MENIDSKLKKKSSISKKNRKLFIDKDIALANGGKIDPALNIAGATLSTAATGASLGSMAGPVGTVIGGVGGAVLGFGKSLYDKIQNDKEKESLLEAEMRANSINNTQEGNSFKEGGLILGKGTSKSDSIKKKMPIDSFIVPAENKEIAQELGQAMLNWDKKQKLKGTASMPNKVSTKLSNNEVAFLPKEVEKLNNSGIDLNKLAPKANRLELKNTFVTGGPVKPLKNSNKLKDYYSNLSKEERSAIEKELADMSDVNSGPGLDLLSDNRYNRLKKSSLKKENINNKRNDISKTPSKGDIISLLKNTLSNSNMSSVLKSENKNSIEKNISDLVDRDIFSEPNESLNTNLPLTIKNDIGSKKLISNSLTDYYNSNNNKKSFQTNFANDAIKKNSLDGNYSLSSIFNKNNPIKTDESSPKLPEVADSNLKMDPITLLGLGQTALGLTQSLTNKNTEPPVPTKNVELTKALARANSEAKYGMTALEKADAENNIEVNRRVNSSNIREASGGSSGVALQGELSSALNANRAKQSLLEYDNKLKMDKQRYADSFLNPVMNEERYIDSIKNRRFERDSSAYAGLLDAGISNTIGAYKYRKQLDFEKQLAKEGKLIFKV